MSTLPCLTIKLFSSLTRRLPIAMLLVFPGMLLLTGCQYLPFNQTDDAQQVVINVNPQPIQLPKHEFALPAGQNIIGELATINAQQNDTLSDFARHFGLGFNEIASANPELNPWVLTDNAAVVLPLRFILPDNTRQGIVLNLAEMRIFYFSPHHPGTVFSYPVGIGREDWDTPLGNTQIIAKRANPSWTVPESIKREHQAKGEPLPNVVPPGPDNPLGSYALPLGIGKILIHGTNKPYGIGMQVSHGCVQLYPEDIAELFQAVEVGTPVSVIHQPYLAAWEGEMLYLEAHPLLDKWSKQAKPLQKELYAKLNKLATEHHAQLDWARIASVLSRADGIPTPILNQAADLASLTAAAPHLPRPAELYQQPMPKPITSRDGTVLAKNFKDAGVAQKLTAMLNHLDNQLAARIIPKPGVYQVVVGPFKNEQALENSAKHIYSAFAMKFNKISPQKVLE